MYRLITKKRHDKIKLIIIALEFKNVCFKICEITDSIVHYCRLNHIHNYIVRFSASFSTMSCSLACANLPQSMPDQKKTKNKKRFNSTGIFTVARYFGNIYLSIYILFLFILRLEDIREAIWELIQHPTTYITCFMISTAKNSFLSTNIQTDFYWSHNWSKIIILHLWPFHYKFPIERQSSSSL